MNTFKITVFTATYNRAYSLPKLYQSLKKQTFKDFEWLIVDDGSTDETQNLLSTWMDEENEFDITYLRVKNGGKHRAINKGTDLARGMLFFIVDSDDYLTPTALERIDSWENTLSAEQKKIFAGVAGCKGYSEKNMIGSTFEGEFLDASSLEREKYNIMGDKSEVFFTEILRNYKFPEIEGERFITESVVWYHLAHDGYKLRWFNEIIYIAEYLSDGLSKNINDIVKKSPKGETLRQELYQKHHGGFIKKEKEEFLVQVKHLLLEGDTEKCIQLFDSLFEELMKDLELQLLLTQVYIYKNDIKKAWTVLEKTMLMYPKEDSIYLKASLLGRLRADKAQEINARQKALLYCKDKVLCHKLLKELKEKDNLEDSQILAFNYNNLRVMFNEGRLQNCIDLIMSDSGFDNAFQLELKALQDNDYLKEFIVRLILGNIEGCMITEKDLSYAYGHLYFEAGYYNQSLNYFKEIQQINLTPLTLYRMSKLYMLEEQQDKATKYHNLYLNYDI